MRNEVNWNGDVAGVSARPVSVLHGLAHALLLLRPASVIRSYHENDAESGDHQRVSVFLQNLVVALQVVEVVKEVTKFGGGRRRAPYCPLLTRL